ncbi:DUF3653 domain-containing protein [Lysobacter sp. MMG2]|uniref:DUF3653 domain-containing protein n=1 Tax=Lysobacter sp. MMG2 TaxID=2801338 RepID=UPI001C247C91|nr:DUF3653 domain-containing protein [Lysobacter sp. MMG2]
MTDVDFDGDWNGWRLRGRNLVSEDGQRMTVERLRGLMWRDKMELLKVVVIELAEIRHRGTVAS